MIAAAAQAREQAYAPYSGFAVGAALLAADGTVYCGCNIENAAFPAGICAERAALSAAVSQGCRSFVALALLGGPVDAAQIDTYCWPCGVCRQALSEFCAAEMPVFSARSQTDYQCVTLRELLPLAFSAADLQQK